MRIACGPGDAPHQQGRWRWLAQVVQLRAEQAAVEQLRVKGAPAGQGTWQVRVIVRVLRRDGITHPAAAGQRFDHLRCVVQVGLQAGRVDLAARGSVEVAPRLFDTVVAALACEVVIVGDPDAAARDRRGAAELVALFQDQHAETLVGKEHRRGHRTGPRADHYHVVLGLRLILSRHCCCAIR
ncbi:hypothetical protein D3C76_800080 [compost metagenome]